MIKTLIPLNLEGSGQQCSLFVYIHPTHPQSNHCCLNVAFLLNSLTPFFKVNNGVCTVGEGTVCIRLLALRRLIKKRCRVENDSSNSALNHLVALFQLLKTLECTTCSVPLWDQRLPCPLNKGFYL